MPDEIDRLAAGVRKARELMSLMSEFEDLYREVILDHYKNPHNYGLLEPHDAHAEGQNPLCGDEVTVSIRSPTTARRSRRSASRAAAARSRRRRPRC